MINLDEVPERCESPDEGSATFVPQAQEENSSSREISNSCTNRLRSNRPIILIVVLILVVSGVICVFRVLTNSGACAVHGEGVVRQLRVVLSLSLGKVAQLQEERKQLDAQLRESMQLEEKIQRQWSILFSSKLSLIWSLCNNETFECSRCLPGWIEHGSSCFFLSKDIKNWEEARAECMKMGGDLVVVQNEQHQAFLTNMTYEYSLQDANFHSAWIGLQDLVKDKAFVWANGSILQESFDDWKYKKPNSSVDSKEGMSGNCVAVVLPNATNQKWYDTWRAMGCLNSRHYLCESNALILF